MFMFNMCNMCIYECIYCYRAKCMDQLIMDWMLYTLSFTYLNIIVFVSSDTGNDMPQSSFSWYENFIYFFLLHRCGRCIQTYPRWVECSIHRSFEVMDT